jgi:hypothetical protein
MTLPHKPLSPREFFNRHRNPRSMQLEATAKAKELDPSAFAVYREGTPKHERCQILVEGESFSDDGVCHVWVGLIGSGATWGEALGMAYAWREEEQRKALGRS